MVQISQGDINHPQVDEQWDLVGSLTIWFIWKACYREVFKGIKEHPMETVMKIWLEIIHTLQGQYDAIRGASDKATKRRLDFHKVWQHGPFCIQKGGRILWQYAPLEWLFPSFILSQQRSKIF